MEIECCVWCLLPWAVLESMGRKRTSPSSCERCEYENRVHDDGKESADEWAYSLLLDDSIGPFPVCK